MRELSIKMQQMPILQENNILNYVNIKILIQILMFKKVNEVLKIIILFKKLIIVYISINTFLSA